MNSVFQLVIAGVFAIAAAGLNWLYLASQDNPVAYVAVRSKLDRGQTIEDEDLVAVPVPGDPERLKTALIPFQNRSILLGGKASRDYVNGDMIYARDLVAPVEQRQWDVIGPFELISVAEHFKQPAEGEDRITNSIGRNTITVAVDAAFDRNTNRLLEAIATDSRRGPDDLQARIVAVQVVPSTASRLTSSSTNPIEDATIATRPGSRRDVVYQTVSLEGIASVPRVLLEGEFIRFVVPREPGAP